MIAVIAAACSSFGARRLVLFWQQKVCGSGTPHIGSPTGLPSWLRARQCPKLMQCTLAPQISNRLEGSPPSISIFPERCLPTLRAVFS